MTKSDSVSVYRRFSPPVRGKIIGRHYVDGNVVYDIVVTSRLHPGYPTGTTLKAVSGEIYDTHRELASGRIAFTGKTWQARQARS